MDPLLYWDFDFAIEWVTLVVFVVVQLLLKLPQVKGLVVRLADKLWGCDLWERTRDWTGKTAEYAMILAWVGWNFFGVHKMTPRIHYWEELIFEGLASLLVNLLLFGFAMVVGCWERRRKAAQEGR